MPWCRSRSSLQEAGLPAALAGYQLRILQCLTDVQEYDTVLAVTAEAVATGVVDEWLYLYRALAYAAQDDADQARAQYQLALEIHPGWAPAQEGLTGLLE